MNTDSLPSVKFQAVILTPVSFQDSVCNASSSGPAADKPIIIPELYAMTLHFQPALLL